ncbi:MAG: Transposase [Lactobacillus delbrueckii]
MSSLLSFDTKNEPQISRSVEKFFKDYKVMELLRRCGLRKSKGIPLWLILSYIFGNVFPDRSMYMQQKSGKCTRTPTIDSCRTHISTGFASLFC